MLTLIMIAKLVVISMIDYRRLPKNCSICNKRLNLFLFRAISPY